MPSSLLIGGLVCDNTLDDSGVKHIRLAGGGQDPPAQRGQQLLSGKTETAFAADIVSYEALSGIDANLNLADFITTRSFTSMTSPQWGLALRQPLELKLTKMEGRSTSRLMVRFEVSDKVNSGQGIITSWWYQPSAGSPNPRDAWVFQQWRKFPESTLYQIMRLSGEYGKEELLGPWFKAEFIRSRVGKGDTAWGDQELARAAACIIQNPSAMRRILWDASRLLLGETTVSLVDEDVITAVYSKGLGHNVVVVFDLLVKLQEKLGRRMWHVPVSPFDPSILVEMEELPLAATERIRDSIMHEAFKYMVRKVD